MEHTRTLPNGKPYEIRERLFEFACNVVTAAQKLHMKGPIAGALSLQLVKSAVSAAANAEEADDGSSKRDFRAKKRITLRELKESRLRLRVLRRTGFVGTECDPIIAESLELIRIVATIIKKTQIPRPKSQTPHLKRRKDSLQSPRQTSE